MKSSFGQWLETVIGDRDDYSSGLRAYLNDRHVCDGGDVGCSFRRIARSNMSILQGLPTTKCAQIAPSLRVAATTGVCIVARLDHIDIWPAPCASHPSP